ncbi:sigma-70 family RNA polymerase sigma factor [Anaerorhabdus sp.]|uniref:RNA polymerase sigma factor n=1 Tax=Anaerorhabdus sp. TaxID=1872524 RepID=UPI002B221028|nr:sigma-70 family RNA polymerase sigma factor [Anaerorhabdus sp.]MEA4874295.1 sigma-70 family RNA polymerase sigma factor [Anaerorhabdus sp.]
MTIKLSHIELGELLENAKNGDESSFEKLYTATVSSQYFIALKNTKDVTLAQEVVQELYIKLFQYMDRIKNSRLFIAYLNRMNYSISMDLLAKAQKETYLDIDEIENTNYDFIGNMQKLDKDNLLIEAIEELDEELKTIINLRYLEEYQVNEIARELKISRRTVTRKLNTGLKDLKKIFTRLKNTAFSFGGFTFLYVIVTAKKDSERLAQGRVFPVFYHIVNYLSSFNFNAFMALIQSSLQINVSILGKLLIGITVVTGNTDTTMAIQKGENINIFNETATYSETENSEYSMDTCLKDVPFVLNLAKNYHKYL